MNGFQENSQCDHYATHFLAILDGLGFNSKIARIFENQLLASVSVLVFAVSVGA
jgi:hypothetical protein